MSRRTRLALVAATLGLLVTLPGCWGLIPGQPLFCGAFCGKCQSCHAENPDFAEDGCYYENDYGSFDLDDCVAGCLDGALPGHPMPPSWQTWSCAVFDDFL